MSLVSALLVEARYYPVILVDLMGYPWFRILRQEGEADLFRAGTLSTTGSDSDFDEDNTLRSDDEENQDDDLVMD